MFRFSPIFYRDEGSSPAGSPAGSPAPTPATAAPAAATPTVVNAEEFLKAYEARQARAGESMKRSYAEQKGIDEAQLDQLVTDYKKAQAAKLPDDVQKQIDAEKAELQKYKLGAEVAKEGAALGLLDADIAMALLPADATKPNDKGEFAGLKSALEKLKADKPYLFKPSDPAPTGQKKDVGGKVTTTTTETTLDQFKRMGYPARVELKKSNLNLYNTLIEQERTASADGKK